MATKRKNRLASLINAFRKETDKFMRLKVKYYAQAYDIEQVFVDECSRNAEFARQNKSFEAYMAEQVPHFDYMDYLKFKGFMAIGKTDVISRLDNSAIDYVRDKTVGKRGLLVPLAELKQAIDEVAEQKTEGVITYDDVYDYFKDIRKVKRKAPGKAPKVRIEPKYTRKELNALTKNDLINLCMNLQKQLAKASVKAPVKSQRRSRSTFQSV